MPPRAYYNENEKYCADWLRNLIAEGLIADGDVDDRDIRDVEPDDLAGYTQCHFFAGIGGWSYSLRRAGWPDHREVWTGSCPCQPFSVAGAQKGFDDTRHVWPHWHRLIRERRPPKLFGEQVAGASQWLRLVRSDLEALGYAVGAMPIEAASAHADHFRDRYWLVADHDEQRPGEGRLQPSGQLGRPSGDQENHSGALAHGHGHGQRSQIEIGQSSDIGTERATAARDRLCAVVNDPIIGWGEGWTEHEFRSRGFTAAVASIDGCQFVECPDGKWRRLPPPGVRWLGTRVPARVAKLRAIGNAIDWRPAAAFIGAYLELNR